VSHYWHKYDMTNDILTYYLCHYDAVMMYSSNEVLTDGLILRNVQRHTAAATACRPEWLHFLHVRCERLTDLKGQGVTE
jgi:hypothetical protein